MSALVISFCSAVRRKNNTRNKYLWRAAINSNIGTHRCVPICGTVVYIPILLDIYLPTSPLSLRRLLLPFYNQLLQHYNLPPSVGRLVYIFHSKIVLFRIEIFQNIFLFLFSKSSSVVESTFIYNVNVNISVAVSEKPKTRQTTEIVGKNDDEMMENWKVLDPNKKKTRIKFSWRRQRDVWN